MVVLDEFFPCLPLSTPIFSRSENQELWVLLLEKAFAKTRGSYAALERGSSRSALVDLTKCPVFTYDFQSKETLELVYGADYERQLELLGREDARSSERSNGTRRSASNEDSLGGVRNSFGDPHMEPKNSHLISPVRSLRFSLIKTSKPAKNFWEKLRSALSKGFIVLAVQRDEADETKEGFGYNLLRATEAEEHRLIGSLTRAAEPVASAGPGLQLGRGLEPVDGEAAGVCAARPGGEGLLLHELRGLRGQLRPGAHLHGGQVPGNPDQGRLPHLRDGPPVFREDLRCKKWPDQSPSR